MPTISIDVYRSQSEVLKPESIIVSRAQLNGARVHHTNIDQGFAKGRQITKGVCDQLGEDLLGR